VQMMLKVRLKQHSNSKNLTTVSILKAATDDECFVDRSKDLRPEAKNFKIFFVHTVSAFVMFYLSKFCNRC